MSKNYNRTGFETAFKKAVYNFDETKLFFTHSTKSYEHSIISFVLDGKLKRLHIHKSQYDIDIWKNYFIEFLKTGNFDYNAYWQLYGNISKEESAKIYKFPLCVKFGNDFYTNSDEMFRFLYSYRKEKGDCGMKQVAKPE